METFYCDALKFAIELEEEGRKFYLEAATKVKDKVAKRTLEFLADEELTHIQKIKQFNLSLLGKEEFDLEKECTSKLPKKIRNYLKEIVKKDKEIKPSTDEVNIYTLALDMENKSYNLYKDAYEKNKEDEKLKKFFNFLMEEETEHYNLLLASKRYLEDSSYYFEDYGGWIFGGA